MKDSRGVCRATVALVLSAAVCGLALAGEGAVTIFLQVTGFTQLIYA